MLLLFLVFFDILKLFRTILIKQPMDSSHTHSVLTIAGSDPSGGAGIQADLKTLTALRVYGATAITALTAQNTTGVQAVQTISADFVRAQMDSVFSDNHHLNVVKTGMLANTSIIRTVAQTLRDEKRKRRPHLKLVMDPVLVATSGDQLVDKQGREDQVVKSMIEEMFPLATIVTPNLPEAIKLCGMHCKDMGTMTGIEQMRFLATLMVEKLGCPNVLVKGGHMDTQEMDMACDVFYDGKEFEAMVKPWISTPNSHGTGCTLASAIAAGLADGRSVKDAVRAAKEFVWRGLTDGTDLDVGAGNGPLFHMHTVAQFSC